MTTEIIQALVLELRKPEVLTYLGFHMLIVFLGVELTLMINFILKKIFRTKKTITSQEGLKPLLPPADNHKQDNVGEGT